MTTHAYSACIIYIDINSYYASMKPMSDPLVIVTRNGYHDNVDL